jgi:acylphosphatase
LTPRFRGLMKTIHAVIHGKVQGVFFRDSTRTQAQQLSINGWVRNNHDGTVELEATGNDTDLDIFKHWLHDGPTHACVDRVVLEEIELKEFTNFEIR